MMLDFPLPQCWSNLGLPCQSCNPYQSIVLIVNSQTQFIGPRVPIKLFYKHLRTIRMDEIKEPRKSEKKKTTSKKKKDTSSKKDDTILPEINFLERFAQATANDETWKSLGQNFIWISDPIEIYIIAEVSDREKNSQDFVVMTPQGERRRCKISEIFPINPPSFSLCDDLAGLYHLSDYAILHTLRSRYERNKIYVF